MRSNEKIIDAPGLVRGVRNDHQGMEIPPAPSKIAEAAVRLLGTMLVLYRHYVPNSEYYKVDHTAAQ